MLEIAICLMIGYLIGTLNPAALLSWVKHINLKEVGTKNLGATNTFMVIGRGYGILVMLLDIAKAFFAVKIMELLFPRMVISGLLAGVSAVFGHVFPFYMGFRGGKGLAAFAGAILAFDGVIFSILLVVCMGLMLIINYAVVLPISAAILFPLVTALRHQNAVIVLLALIVSVLVLVKNWSNLRRAVSGEEIKFTEYFKKTA